MGGRTPLLPGIALAKQTGLVCWRHNARVLIRPDGDDLVAIGQASHAWLSGQLARAWGNDRFVAPQPREEVCLAAEQHDVGMAEWDLAPRLHPTEGRPVSFMEMELDEHLRLWSAAPAKLLSQNPYAALLVSMHGTALYELRDLDLLGPADAGAVRSYLARERDWQDRLLAVLGADREQARRNQRLLFAWDGLSLALCLRWDGYEAGDVPAAGDEERAVRLEPLVDGLFTLDPWPLASDEVTVRCAGRRLTGRCSTEAELHAALEEAPAVALSFTLVPP